MTEPSTVNLGLVIPNTGDLSGTWGSAALNPDFVAIDGTLCGFTTISASSSPITLTVPVGFTATPSAGPTQAQNAGLIFSGALTANVQVTLPIPGRYVISNRTTGNFVLSFRAVGSGTVIGVDQQDDIDIYNDGTNVRFVNLGRIGATEMWAGYTAIPAWVTACTNVPYLLCDGTVYNVSSFPSLGTKLLGKFGGNGVTTFAVPDSQGRVQLPYDGTGTRITTGGCGINGQTMGASQDKQTNTLITGNLPPYTPSGSIVVTGGSAFVGTGGFQQAAPQGGNPLIIYTGATIASTTSWSFSGSAQGGTSTPLNNVQPSQVTGIMVIRAG